MQAAVALTIDAGLARVTLDRPDTLNALNPAMVRELAEVLDQVAAADSVRCVLLQGRGEHFMAGGDLGFFADWIRDDAGLTDASERALFESVNSIILQITQMPKPVVACIQGSAAGYGLSLVLACDLAIAASDALFTVAYSQIAATPDGGMTYHLPSLIGHKRAMELVLLNEPFDAATALEWGMVNRVVEPDQLPDACQALVDSLLQGAATSMGRTKRLFSLSSTTTLSQQLDAEAAAFRQLKGDTDFAEGVEAFLGKRKPQFNL